MFEADESEYYDGKGEEGGELPDSNWDADTYVCRCDTTRGKKCTCADDVAQELEWLQECMAKLEGEIVAAENRTRRCASSRGVPDDAVKDIYSYLLEDMANECVAVLACGAYQRLIDGLIDLCASSVPLTKEHLEALNAFVFHRVPVEEVGLVPAALEWVKLECQLGTAQKRFTVLKKWQEDHESELLARLLAGEGVTDKC